MKRLSGYEILVIKVSNQCQLILLKLHEKQLTIEPQTCQTQTWKKPLTTKRYFRCNQLGEAKQMIWEVCIRYPNGQERALRSYKDREIALKRIDAIYSEGYPMHVAYIVRSAEIVSQPLTAASL